jgi:hypothetical protein
MDPKVNNEENTKLIDRKNQNLKEQKYLKLMVIMQNLI